jgi:hypothetical protein
MHPGASALLRQALPSPGGSGRVGASLFGGCGGGAQGHDQKMNEKWTKDEDGVRSSMHWNEGPFFVHF